MTASRWILGTVMAAGLVVSTSTWAGDPPQVPATLAGIEVAGSDQVMKLVESGGGLIIDARKAEDFKGGAIPGSVNCQVSSGHPDLSDAEVDATVAKLNADCAPVAKADKKKPVAMYCNGETCWRSPKGALALKKMGFEKVLWYRLGGNDWKQKGLPME